jgi:hypothetical protein
MCVKSQVLGFGCPACIANEVVSKRHDDELMQTKPGFDWRLVTHIYITTSRQRVASAGQQCDVCAQSDVVVTSERHQSDGERGTDSDLLCAGSN